MALTPALSARVRHLVGDAVRVDDVPSLARAEDALQHSVGACLLLGVPGEGHADCAIQYQRFRRRFPYVPVVAVFVPGVSTHRGTMTLGRIGVTDILSADTELKLGPLYTALKRCQAHDVSHRVWEECGLSLPHPLVTVLKTALRLALEPISARLLADAAGIPERSLRKFCEDNGIPSPRWVIGWARLLTAAHYLDEPGRTLAQVAELLQYPSSCALRNQLRRYTASSPRTLRREGILRRICAALETAVAADGAVTQGQQSLRLIR